MKNLHLPTVEAIGRKRYGDLSPNTIFRRISGANTGQVFCARGRVAGQSGLRAFRIYHTRTIAPTSLRTDLPPLDEVVEILPESVLSNI